MSSDSNSGNKDAYKTIKKKAGGPLKSDLKMAATMGSRLRNEISSAQSALSVHHRLQTNFKDETSRRDPAATAGLDSG